MQLFLYLYLFYMTQFEAETLTHQGFSVVTSKWLKSYASDMISTWPVCTDKLHGSTQTHP